MRSSSGPAVFALLLLALTHVAEPPLVLAEMRRILKPGGRAVVVDLLRHDNETLRREMGQLRLGFAVEELTAMLTESGFAAVTCRPLAPEPQAKGPALLLAAADATPPVQPAATPRKPRGKEKERS